MNSLLGKQSTRSELLKLPSIPFHTASISQVKDRASRILGFEIFLRKYPSQWSKILLIRKVKSDPFSLSQQSMILLFHTDRLKYTVMRENLGGKNPISTSPILLSRTLDFIVSSYILLNIPKVTDIAHERIHIRAEGPALRTATLRPWASPGAAP